jgi:mannose-6-phosphate isomerase-like protein (cupin superfamily)
MKRDFEIPLPPALETIDHAGTMLALIVRRHYRKDGIEFFTPGSFSQQIGYMNRPAGHVIPPHVHTPVPREVQFTKEVLFIRSGRLRVDFYDADQAYLESTVLESGDVILLAQGGHGFTMLEPTEIIEVKQGPYAGDRDKTRFDGVAEGEVRMRTSGLAIEARRAGGTHPGIEP